MNDLREAAQQALKALETIREADTAGATPKMVVEARKMYEPTITALRAALAEPQSGWDKWQAQKRGCSVCGVGANGETVGYVCIRNDCPTRVTCGGTP